MAKALPFIVIDGPGFYGSQGRVYSTHATLNAARLAAKRHSYVDERGQRRSIAIVAKNDYGQYKAGGTFWSDMPPTTLE